MAIDSLNAGINILFSVIDGVRVHKNHNIMHYDAVGMEMKRCTACKASFKAEEKQNISWFMDKKYICYCGLYCENCPVKAKIAPAAKVLYKEMKEAGFEEIIHMIPGGDGFWPFLKDMADGGVCTSCQDGSGNPGCAVRICAQEKGVEICALCESYPCEKFDPFFEGYSVLKQDNALLREEGMDAWAKLQDERRAKGFTYADKK